MKEIKFVFGTYWDDLGLPWGCLKFVIRVFVCICVICFQLLTRGGAPVTNSSFKSLTAASGTVPAALHLPRSCLAGSYTPLHRWTCQPFPVPNGRRNFPKITLVSAAGPIRLSRRSFQPELHEFAKGWDMQVCNSWAKKTPTKKPYKDQTVVIQNWIFKKKHWGK